MSTNEKDVDPHKRSTIDIDVDSKSVAMDYYILQDGSYNNRFNIFVALQGGLLVFSSIDSPLLIDRNFMLFPNISISLLIFLFGLLTSVIWLYSQLKQTAILTHMRDSLVLFYPSLSRVISNNPKRDGFRLSNFKLLNLVPILFIAIWVGAAIASFNSPIDVLEKIDQQAECQNKK